MTNMTPFQQGLEAAEAAVRGERVLCPFDPDTQAYSDWHEAFNDWFDY